MGGGAERTEMPITCSRCGGTFAESEVNDRFQGVCPRCLAQAAVGSGSEAEDWPPPLAPGQSFQGLEIVEVLGAGGMGVVYKARQPHLDRFVALKVLPRRLAQDPQFVERFRREAKALAALSHANIVGVHDFGIAGDVSYLVMEYVEGMSLRGALGGTKLSPEQAMAIIPQLCDALQYAHEEGIVHRDIKPENILLDKKGRVKIADFGLAKIVGGEATRLSPITRTGYVLGTPSYMAPEQMETPERVDHRADIYSMGVVFYEMLTGELPLGAFSPPSKKVDVDVRLDQVVIKALAREPERRYQHASEVKEDVSRVTRTEGPPSGARRRRSRLAWIALLGVLALLGVEESWRRNRSTGPATPQSTPDWLDKLSFEEEDLPGLLEFDAPGTGLPPGPFLAQNDLDVRREVAAFTDLGVGGLGALHITRAYAVVLKDGPLGFLAFTTSVPIPSHDLEGALTFGGDIDAHWTFCDARRAVVAVGWGEAGPGGATFEQLVDGVAVKIGERPPYPLPSFESVSIEEKDLPVGCAIVSRWALGDPRTPNGPSPTEETFLRAGVRRAPRGVKRACIWRIGPGDIFAFAVEIPSRPARVAFAGSIPVSETSSHAQVEVIGSLVVACSANTAEATGRLDRSAIWQCLCRKLGLYGSAEESLRGQLAGLARVELEPARRIAQGIAGSNRSDVLKLGLTAMVLGRLADRDVQWLPGATPERLMEELSRTQRQGQVSILSSEYVRSLSVDAMEVEVPACLRMRVGFGCRREQVKELRLPMSGGCLMNWGGMGWELSDGKPQSKVKYPDSSSDVRGGADAVARHACLNYVLSPEVRGVAVQTGNDEWKSELKGALGLSDAGFSEGPAGIVRIAPRSWLPRIEATPVLTGDASAPRVTLDAEAADLRESLKAFGSAGGARIELDPAVKGRFTARLVDVPWMDALSAAASTCGFAATRDPSGTVRVAPAPEAPPPKLNEDLIRKEDLPEGWTFRVPTTVRLAHAEVEVGLSQFLGVQDLKSTQVAELCTWWLQGPQEHSNDGVVFLVLYFYDLDALAALEAKAKRTAPWRGERRHFVFHEGAVLALGFLYGDADKDFDALCERLRSRLEPK